MNRVRGDRMRAWAVTRPGPVDTRPLELVTKPVPEPGPGQIRVRVATCGVCRTDLHVAEGNLPPRGETRVPGHEVVGYVDEQGPGSERFAVGQRVGLAWLAGTCGRCQYCRRGQENLCAAPTFRGWDVDGGYAEYALADEAFAYSLSDRLDDLRIAPLLCAGIIGYRALRRAELPPGGHLGLYGFGGSAHLTAQVARAEGATLHVMTRSSVDQELARALGAAFVGNSSAPHRSPWTLPFCLPPPVSWFRSHWPLWVEGERSPSRGSI